MGGQTDARTNITTWIQLNLTNCYENKLALLSRDMADEATVFSLMIIA